MAYSPEEMVELISEKMPALSQTASKVIALARDINCSPYDLTRVIKLDPVLSAKVLKLVNSSYFMLSARVQSLEKAVILLGLNTIRNLALTAAILAQMDEKGRSYPFDIDAFWKHSLGVGVASRRIAELRNVDKKLLEDFFLAGLLHDLGLLVESLIYPEETERLVLTSRSLGLLAMEEAEMGGLNHCAIGRALGVKWGLSEELGAVLEHHHAPLAAAAAVHDKVLTVYLANVICKNNAVGLVLDETPIEVEPDAFARLGLTEDVEADIMRNIDDQIRRATEFLRT